ncbi:MAG: hypothetical protein H7X99_12080 [Saprospiraceae bacterium]|nr:hypothetical protein [Saprospiraceae bacterium]
MENKDSLDKIIQDNWVRMHDMLDLEMPVKRKERKMIFFMWSFVVFLFALISIWIGNQSMSDEVTGKVKKILPLNINKLPDSDFAVKENELPQNNASGQFTPTTAKNKIQDNGSAFHKKNLSSAKHISNISKNEANIPSSAFTQGSGLSNDVERVGSAEMADMSKLDSNGDLPETTERAVSLDKVIFPLPIHVAPLQYISFVQAPKLNMVQLSKSVNWQFGATLGLSTSNFKTTENYLAGIFAEYSLHNKIHLFSRIGIRSYTSNSVFLRSDAVTNNAEQSSNDMTDGFVGNTLNLSGDKVTAINEHITRAITKRTDYLEFQVGAKYLFSGKISINGSVNFGSFLHASYALNDDAQQLYTKYNQGQTLSETKIRSIEPLYQKWITTLNAGVEWRIHRKFSISGNLYLIRSKNTSVPFHESNAGGFTNNDLSLNNYETNYSGFETAVRYYFH